MLPARATRSASLLRPSHSILSCCRPNTRLPLSSPSPPPIPTAILSSRRLSGIRPRQQQLQAQQQLKSLLPSRRTFHLSPHTAKGLQPDSADPAPPKPQQHSAAAGGASHVAQPAEITADEYHEIADLYMEELVAVLEEKAESGQSGFDVDYSAGVLNLTTPHGTYVINKQPPNRQIWVTSPISGPKRYNWVAVNSGGQDQKADTGLDVEGDLRGGQWVYLRDGTLLSDWLRKELDVLVGKGDGL